MAENAAQKKPGFFARVKRFFKDAAGEMKKIVWPGPATVRNNTGIVLTVVVIASVFVGCFDLIITQLIQLFVGAL